MWVAAIEDHTMSMLTGIREREGGGKELYTCRAGWLIPDGWN